MSIITRRGCIRSSLAVLAGTRLGKAAPSGKPQGKAKGKPGIQLADFVRPNEQARLMKQLGVNYAITGAGLGKVRREEYADHITKLKEQFKSVGMEIAGFESHPVPAERIKLGAEGRDEEIENYKWAIAAMAKTGIPMICYNFMAGLGWYRTKTDVRERGGALTSEFNLAESLAQGPTQWGELSEEKMWANMEYFQKAVMPVADKFGIKMALHPDDPPISPLRGIARILVSARNYRRVMDMAPSRVNGVTFCQANFRAMGENIETLARDWSRQGKIFFVHFRDIAGTKEHFRETFHDNGPTDMAKMLKIYHENGFRGPLRLDHAPTFAGEAEANTGYGMQGRLFAMGYIKGLLDGQGIPFE